MKGKSRNRELTMLGGKGMVDDDERFEDIPKSLTKLQEGKQNAARKIILYIF